MDEIIAMNIINTGDPFDFSWMNGINGVEVLVALLGILAIILIIVAFGKRK